MTNPEKYRNKEPLFRGYERIMLPSKLNSVGHKLAILLFVLLWAFPFSRLSGQFYVLDCGLEVVMLPSAQRPNTTVITVRLKEGKEIFLRGYEMFFKFKPGIFSSTVSPLNYRLFVKGMHDSIPQKVNHCFSDSVMFLPNSQRLRVETHFLCDQNMLGFNARGVLFELEITGFEGTATVANFFEDVGGEFRLGYRVRGTDKRGKPIYGPTERWRLNYFKWDAENGVPKDTRTRGRPRKPKNVDPADNPGENDGQNK